MNNVSKAEQDKFVQAIRVMESLMRDELNARKRRYFSTERMIRELRRTILDIT